MVGGLVEAQQGGRPHQHARQRQAGLLAARQHRDLLVDGVARKQECAEDRAQARVGRLGRHRLQLFQHRPGRHEGVQLMLGVVVNGHVRAQCPLAPLERQHAGQDLQQRRLAGAVLADQGQPLAPLHRDVDARVDDVVAVGLVDAGQRGHAAAGARRLRKREVHLAARAGQLDALDTLQHLDAALHLAGLGRLVAEPLDEALDLGDALGLVARARLEQLAPGLALDQEVVVVARVHREAVGAEVGDRGDHPVQEIAVVRDHDHGPVVAGQEVLQPGEGGEVQVVGRLVQQQQRWRQQEQPRQRRPHAPAAGKLRQRAMQLVGPEAEAAQDGARRRLEPIAAERLEAVLEIAVARGERVTRRRLEGAGDVLHLALERPHLVEAAQRFHQHGAGGAGGDLLRQIPDGGGARAAHLPGVRLVETGQDPAERGLAGAVGADEPDALAVELDHRPPITPSSGFSRARSSPSPAPRRAGGWDTCPSRGTSWPGRRCARRRPSR